jgi:hypothetical protein
MWVEVNERIEGPGEVWYRGTLTNQPRHISDLLRGALIEFNERHIASTEVLTTDPRCWNLSRSACSSHVESWNH